jgi:hypothetical protein
VKRHACSVIGTRQYRRMVSSCARAPLAGEPGNIEAAGKAGKQETNASDLFKVPQAAEGRETNAPCRREMAENMGARETNMPEEETAAVRRDGELLASASRNWRQGFATAAEHLAAAELSAPPQEGAVARGILQPMCLDSGAGDQMERDRYRPMQPMLFEPRHHQRVQRTGAEQRAAAGARGAS